MLLSGLRVNIVQTFDFKTRTLYRNVALFKYVHESKPDRIEHLCMLLSGFVLVSYLSSFVTPTANESLKLEMVHLRL